MEPDKPLSSQKAERRRHQHASQVNANINNIVQWDLAIIGINMLLNKLEKRAIEMDNNPLANITDEELIYSIKAARDKITKHYLRTN
nr:unnamed protein product [Callosobruchus analis]